MVSMVLYCRSQFSLARAFDMRSCYSALFAVRICVLSLSGRANLVWASDDVFFFFRSLPADSIEEKREHQTVKFNTVSSFGFKRS